MPVKRNRTFLAALGFLALVGIVLAAVYSSRRIATSQSQTTEQSRTSVKESNGIPPAPPVPASLPNRKLVRSHSLVSPMSPSSNKLTPLLYDKSLSFQENVNRLQEFCRSHAGGKQLEQALASFLKNLFEEAKSQFSAIKASLEDITGPPAYRNIMLGCFMAADGPMAEKANAVWRVATDPRESVEVRRTASFLTGQVEDTENRSAALSALLNDADAKVAMFALDNSARHLDQATFDLIRTNLAHSHDIHLRLAAINAIGSASFPQSQSTLADILTNTKTSNEDQFSESSLVKRAAISHLDMHNTDVYQAVKKIAFDDNEDPGVRAKAIARFKPADSPKEDGILMDLLGKLDTDMSVPLRATIDALLTAPTPERIEAIRRRLAQLSDPQVRDLLLKKVELAAKGSIP